MQSLSEAINAQKMGAQQIELCSRLDLEGLSPSKELILNCLKSLKIPIKVMVRPHSNGFLYSSSEIDIIHQEIDWLLDSGIDHIVFGALKDGRLDIELISKVCMWSYPMTMTVHKAIDESEDIIADVILLKELAGVDSILSSGASSTAEQGIPTLLDMKIACSDKITLIPAGRINATNVESIHRRLDCKVYHGRRIVDIVG